MIDIGGGFPVTYRDEMPPIGAIAAIVDEVLGDGERFTLLAEPGRFLAADSMTLLTSVVGSAMRGRAGVALPRRRALRQLLQRHHRGRPSADPGAARGGSTAERLRAGHAGGADLRQHRRYRARLPDAGADVGDVLVSPMMGAYTIGDILAVQRHRGDPDRRV